MATPYVKLSRRTGIPVGRLVAIGDGDVISKLGARRAGMSLVHQRRGSGTVDQQCQRNRRVIVYQRRSSR
jgi:hypothetical protein